MKHPAVASFMGLRWRKNPVRVGRQACEQSRKQRCKRGRGLQPPLAPKKKREGLTARARTKGLHIVHAYREGDHPREGQAGSRRFQHRALAAKRKLDILKTGHRATCINPRASESAHTRTRPHSRTISSVCGNMLLDVYQHQHACNFLCSLLFPSVPTDGHTDEEASVRVRPLAQSASLVFQKGLHLPASAPRGDQHQHQRIWSASCTAAHPPTNSICPFHAPRPAA